MQLQAPGSVLVFISRTWWESSKDTKDMLRDTEVTHRREVVVIDGFGANLEPAQIRQRLKEYDDLAEETGLIFVLVTTNRTVIDEMGREGHSFVYIENNGKMVQLTDIYNLEWLSHFALGDLYDREELEE